MLHVITLLLLNRKLVSKANLRLVSVFPDIVKDCPKIRNLPKIFLISFENVNQSINSLKTEMSKRTSTCEKHKAVKYT